MGKTGVDLQPKQKESTMIQPDLFDLEKPPDKIADRFVAWKQTDGAKRVLEDLYRLAAGCFKEYLNYGIRLSMKYLYEVERRKIRIVRAQLKREGKDLELENGYRLNNDFTALIVRHMIERRPSWEEMFETRKRKEEKRY